MAIRRIDTESLVFLLQKDAERFCDEAVLKKTLMRLEL